MKYRNHNYRNSSFRQRHRWLTWLIPAVLLTAGVYLLFLVYSPRLATTPLAPLIGGSSPQTVDARATTPDNADYIIIPKINLRWISGFGDTMSSIMSDYEITDEQIDAMLRYLQNFHPEHANKEFAENWLRYWKSKIRDMSLENLDNDKMEEMFEAFTKLDR